MEYISVFQTDYIDITDFPNSTWRTMSGLRIVISEFCLLNPGELFLEELQRNDKRLTRLPDGGSLLSIGEVFELSCTPS